MNTNSDLREQVFHPENMEWLDVFDEHMNRTIYDRRLVSDPETGMIVNVSKYPAGYYKDFHTHTCAHGIYVLKGILRTDTGLYSPGSFIWHPAGLSARHGATEEEDCEFIFITNKPFDICYLQDVQENR